MWSKYIDMGLTLEIYWKMRDRCSKGEHKFRDNDFGITWCIVCGRLATKPCGKPLLIGEQIIMNNLK